ncbi:sensor domain-containing diguanylate cyclase [Rhodoferax antarcticus]|uniref:sensor domain-containing diguanylate cyclase n=1 Tax=Rhodoferax antarcticus TaxID=81479 RepID=UPI0022259066|nr:PAS domain S-box protein [Rhodoferax antarcticus]MCW2312910.1 diguanylate cyclase (GGDEF)-like protein/PAS domain S-box-containing protein [Rhodoferax antarcticus]
MISVKKFLATGLQRCTALAVLTLLALLALLWSAVAWNHQDAERQELDDIRRETATLARLFANDADSTFRSVDHALLELRSAWVNRPADLGHEVKGYTEFLDEAFLQIAVIGADGNLAYSNLGMPNEPTFLGEREYFKMHQGTLQDKLFVSRPLKGKVSGKWSIQLSRPIFRNAQWVGVVVISVDPNYFVKFYQNAGMGKDGAAGMVRDTGEVMAHSSGQDVYVGKVIEASLFTSPGAPQQGSFRRKSQVDGVERLSSYYRLPQYGLTVLVGPSLVEHLAPLRSQQRQTLLAAGLITVLVLLVAWLLLCAMVRKEAAHQALVVAEAAARDSSQRLNEVIRGAHIATWEWQVQTGATVFNARWAEIVGYTLAELAPISIETWNKLVHPDDAKLSGDLLARCFSRELDTYACEARMRHKEGHWVWVSDRARVVEWAADGKPLRMAGTHQDITERKNAEERLKESEERFRSIANATPVMIWLAGTDTLCYWFNAGWLAFTGRTQEQEMGNGWLEGVHPDDLARCAAFYLRHFEQRLPFQMEYRLRHHSGQYRWIHDSGVPRFDAQGVFVGYIGSCVDAHEVRTIKDQLAAMADAVPGVVYQFIIHPDRRAQFSYLSQGIEALYGVSVEAGLRDHNALMHCIAPQDRVSYSAWAGRASQRLTPWQHEFRIIASDGTPKWVHDQATPQLQSDGSVLWSGILTDITERKQVQEKLKESEQRFRMLFDSSPDAYLIVQMDNAVITDCNHATEVMLRGERAQILGKTPYQLSPLHQPDGRPTADAFAAVIHRLLQKGSHRFECLHQRLDGSDFWVDVCVSVAKMGLQQVLLVNWRDITERKQIHQALQSIETRSRHMFEKNTSVMLLIEPVSGEIMAANPSALAYYGYAAERLVGAPVGLLNTMAAEALAQERQLALSEARNYFNFQHRLASGELRDVEVYSTPIEQGGKALLFSIVHDITARKQVEEKILHMAQHDALTGLANRALFTDRLQRDLASARRDQTSLALMFIDLDKFKPVNDEHGHAVGDLLLQAVTQRMQACVRDSDTLARIGGDEFVVLLRDVAGESEALAVAEKIRASLAQPFELAGHSLNISCCVGVALYPQHGLDDLALSKHADHAMYQAKERGRNQVVLYHAPPV